MLKQKTVLIAEPDIMSAQGIKQYLKTLDYKIHPIVSKGQDLMDMAKLLNPSLIITDINLLGQLDGIEAIARLEGKYNIPYVFITAFDDYSRLIDSYYLNPICLIKKPIRFDDLIKSISKVILFFETVNTEHYLETVSINESLTSNYFNLN